MIWIYADKEKHDFLRKILKKYGINYYDKTYHNISSKIAEVTITEFPPILEKGDIVLDFVGDFGASAMYCKGYNLEEIIDLIKKIKEKNDGKIK